MIHFTCDLCGKKIVSDKELRYVVKIDVYSALSPLSMYDEELDKDPIEEISDLIPNSDDLDHLDTDDGEFRTFRYDLCPACHLEYLKNPLGRLIPRNYGLSGN